MARIVLPLYTPAYLPNGTEHASIFTNKGAISVELFGEECPITVGNFIELARRGFYDDLKFHAVVSDSLVLGGCPTTRNLGPAQVDAAVQGLIRGVHPGVGDARYTIKDEWESNPRNRHIDGSLCFAHKSDPHTGSSQFYFSLATQPEYDDKFTVFGQITEGLNIVHMLTIGDRIDRIEIAGADEAALIAAIAHATPHPQSIASVVKQSLNEQANAAEKVTTQRYLS